MPGINQVTILGNVGKDPDIRAMNSGDRVANFSIATSEKWKDKASGEAKEKTDWHNVVVWGPLVDVIEKYVHKGSKIYVQGKMQTRKWQDKGGVDHYSTEVVLQGFNARLELLDGKPQGDDQGRSGGGYSGGGYSGGNQSRHERPASQQQHDDYPDDSEIPF